MFIYIVLTLCWIGFLAIFSMIGKRLYNQIKEKKIALREILIQKQRLKQKRDEFIDPKKEITRNQLLQKLVEYNITFNDDGLLYDTETGKTITLEEFRDRVRQGPDGSKLR